MAELERHAIGLALLNCLLLEVPHGVLQEFHVVLPILLVLVRSIVTQIVLLNVA